MFNSTFAQQIERYMNKWLLAVFMIGTLSCGHSKKLRRKSVTLDEVTVTANQAAMGIYRGSAARVWDITNTRVALNFDLKGKTANGRAWIDLHPYFYPTDSLELDAKSMKIDSVMLMGSNIKLLTFEHKNDVLKIKFDRAFKATDTIQLYVSYTAMPYSESTGGSKAITDDRGLYFINTDNSIPGKPAQIWTQGETESNSHWMPTIDKPNERFTTRIELTVPDSFVTLSNGYLFLQTREGRNMRRDVWIMDKPIQTYAAMFAIGNFAVVKDEWRGREVSYYVEPQYEPYAHKMFSNTPEMIDCFSKATGVPYPWNKYSQVVVRDYVSGAMENTSASLFGEFVNKNFRQLADFDNEDVVSHELFHQWFGDYVTAESWSNITLNESFANYGETLWRKCKYGKASADEHRIQQMWSYVYGGSKSEPPLVRYHYDSREDVFDRISYQKGGAILYYLNTLMGDSAFYKAMGLYLTKNALQPAEASQWRLAVEEATGQDWNWFFDQWYYRGGHPILNMSYDYDDAKQQLKLTVNQSQKEPAFWLPVKTWVINENNVTTDDWILRERKESFTYPYKNGQRPIVLVDADHVVVGEMNYDLKPAQWLTIYKLSDDNTINKRFAIGAAGKDLDDSSSQAIINLALKDNNVGIRLLTLQNLGRVKTKKWQDKWQQDVLFTAIQDGNNRVRAAAFNTLGIWKVKSGKDEMLSALSDSSYIVAGMALGALKAIDETKTDTVYKLSKQILNNDPKGELQAAAWEVIADKGQAGDISLFEQQAPKMYGRDKIDFAENLSNYLQKVDDNDAFDRALKVFVVLVKTEGIKSYRTAMTAFLFETAVVYKEDVKTAKGNAEQSKAQQRLNKIKSALEEIVKAENEEENLTKYKANMQKLFGK
jgi:aminopeptidase N